MSITRSTRLFATVVIVTVIALFAWRWQAGDLAATAPTADAVSVTALKPDIARQPSAALSEAALNADAVPRSTLASSTAQPERMLVSDIVANPESGLLALSVEEADWLRRHGYPTEEELASVPFMSMDALRARHEQGDVIATALMAHKYRQEGELGKAVAAFNAAASRGSLYARMQSGLASRERNPEYGYMPLVMEAKLAQILGDHRVGAELQRVLPAKALSSFEERDALSNALTQLQMMAQNRRMAGEPNLSIDLRPNLDVWQQVDAGTVADVLVYPRTNAGRGAP